MIKYNEAKRSVPFGCRLIPCRLSYLTFHSETIWLIPENAAKETRRERTKEVPYPPYRLRSCFSHEIMKATVSAETKVR